MLSQVHTATSSNMNHLFEVKAHESSLAFRVKVCQGGLQLLGCANGHQTISFMCLGVPAPPGYAKVTRVSPLLLTVPQSPVPTLLHACPYRACPDLLHTNFSHSLLRRTEEKALCLLFKRWKGDPGEPSLLEGQGKSQVQGRLPPV